MAIAREYVTYMARELARQLVATHAIAAPPATPLAEWLHHSLSEELEVETRINEEARAILAQNEAKLQQLGASYSEAFKKVKAELVRQKKVIL